MVKPEKAKNLTYSFLGNDSETRKFSDDDQQPPKKNDSDGKNSFGPSNNNSQKHPKSFGGIIALTLVFVVIVSRRIYFFGFKRRSTALSYSNADIYYSLDVNKDNIPDEKTADGYPDFSNYEALEKTEDIKTLSEVTTNEGALAKILLNPSSVNNLVINIIQSNERSNLYYLNGTFTKDRASFSFSVAISSAEKEHYIRPIVNYVRVENSQKTYVKYFTSGLTYSSSLEKTSNLSWIRPVIYLVLICALFFFLFSRRSKGIGQGGNPMGGFVDNLARKTSKSKVRFSDVAGCDESKAELVELVDYFKNADKYTRLGAKLPHGVLLVGPPGTGKTLLAKAVAGEANVPFYSISGSDFVERYVGVGASRVRSLFKNAKANAPCLIFIDEIDAVGRQRGAGLGGGNDEREQTLNELLVEMDGFEDNSGIIVIAATNRSDVLDPALTRPGRFDRTITVDLPDQAGRAAILRVHSRNKKIAPDVNFDSIATRTVGFSGADLANIRNDAAILAVRNNRTRITTPDIDEAIDRAIAGPAKKSHLEPAEKRQVAYHEAGHAVIGIFLPYSDKVQKITIVPRGRTGGHVLRTPEKDRFLLTKNQRLARITGYLGGRTSEEIFFGDVSSGASNDIEVATNIARSMVTEYGRSDLGPIQYEKPEGSVFLGRDYTSSSAHYSTQVAFEIDTAVRKIINDCHEQCRKLLEEHRDDVTLIAETLIKNETITSDQIDYLLKNRKLPPVDEHKMESKVEPKNPKDIVLYPGFDYYYTAIDKVLEGNPSRLVLVIATSHGSPIGEEEFKEACVKGAKDPSHIGRLFLDYGKVRNVSRSMESFATHLESYAGVPVLLITTDDETVHNLEKKFSFPAKSEESTSRPGVVKEILPGDKKDETKKNDDHKE